MTTHKFLQELQNLGYKTEFFEDGPQGEYYLFYQSYIDDRSHMRRYPKSKDYEWNYAKMNIKSLENYIGSLFCGGHYTNIRIFKGDEDITLEYEEGPLKDLNPERLIYESDEDESDEEDKNNKNNEDESDEEDKIIKIIIMKMKK